MFLDPPCLPTAELPAGMAANLRTVEAYVASQHIEDEEWTAVLTNSSSRTGQRPELGRGITPCLRPSSRVYIRRQDRLLRGHEALLLQQVGPADFPSLKADDADSKDPLHRDLAGMVLSKLTT